MTSGHFYTCNVLQIVPTCLEGHPLKLGTAIGGSGRYNCNMCRVNIEQSQIFPQKYLKICRIICTLQGSFTQQSSSWRCQEDFRRGGGNCNFDLCVPCMKTLGVNFKFVKIKKCFQADHIAAWPIIRKLAELINLNNHPTPTEEEYADFKRMIKPIPPQLVRKYFF